jgi:hypothetical protein
LAADFGSKITDQNKRGCMENKITIIKNLCKVAAKGAGASKITFFKEKTNNIPVLPILDRMVSLVRENQLVPNPKRIGMIGVQHMLETTASLFYAFMQLGLDPKKMFFTGKCYSSSKFVLNTIRKMGVHIIPDVMPSYLGEYHAACKQGVSDMWKGFDVLIRHLMQSLWNIL